MQIGAMNHPASDPISEIAWFGRHGFDFIDFTFEPPAALPEKVDPEAVRAVLEQHGLDLVAHTAWFLPIGSPFAEVRRAGLNELRRCLKPAREIGARVMNTHFRKPPPLCPSRRAISWHVEVLKPLCEEAAEMGMTIVLEHMPYGGPNQLELFVEILEQVPQLGFHLDSGHARLENRDDRFGEYLDALGDRLLHVHLSDNDGTTDQHLPLGSIPHGGIDWPEHIRKLKKSGYDGTITLEVFSDMGDYILQSRDLLKKWWDEAEG